ncbi:hypothetical protein HPB51_015428 [Rhipicephalus microplus]|uniref:dolichol kinase n=1 Tax=Rhipicephalus microplus TaxID=6941 RepID=A0A9J6DV46_RHIMP|nr:hypothetical protein HPB51_015428 [Rhipicephalus microplus]
MVSWAVLLVIAGLFVYWYTSNYSESSTVVRKAFHAAVVSVFLPGVILDPDLMYLACGAALGVFALLEVFRTLSIPPVGPRIQNAFAMFVDEKDCRHAHSDTCLSIRWLCRTPAALSGTDGRPRQNANFT